MRFHNAFLISVAATGIAAGTSAFAQEQPAQPAQPVAAAAASVNPARGATMDSVRAKFGTPSQEVPAVGKPPITRWEYPGFVVFFEYDRVLHTVAVKE